MGQPTRMRKRSRQRSYLSMTVAFGLAAILLWFLMGKVSVLILPLRLRIVSARWDVFAEQWQGTAFAVRNETVTRAPVSGQVRLLVEEGLRVRAGEAVCEISEKRLTAPVPGVVSFVLDGLEESASQSLTSPLHDVATTGKSDEVVRILDGDQVTPGTPLFRLVDDFTWNLQVAVQGGRRLRPGESVVVSFPGGETRMQIERTEGREGKTLAQLKGDGLPPQCLYLRQFEVRLSASRREGVVVPARSLVSTDGERWGVYVMVGRSLVYQRLEVLATNEKEALVRGLPVGARLVTNPQKVPAKYRR
jgi:hypothetical protein